MRRRAVPANDVLGHEAVKTRVTCMQKTSITTKKHAHFQVGHTRERRVAKQQVGRQRGDLRGGGGAGGGAGEGGGGGVGVICMQG